MNVLNGFFLLYNVIKIVSSDISSNQIDDDSFDDKKFEYLGDKFPQKYMDAEVVVPTMNDLNFYLNNMNRIVDYFAKVPNDTDVNIAVGNFFMKAILKRIIIDYRNKIQKNQLENMMDMINKAEYVLSHYVYKNIPYGWDDAEFRVAQMFKDDTAQVYSIGKFKKNRLKQWIRSKGSINNFIKAMDEATLSKEKYVELVESVSTYYIHIDDSDLCLSRIMYNPEPIDLKEMRPCLSDPYCEEMISSSPSVAYTLSHRLANLLLYHHVRRCYFESPEDDAAHMEVLCAFMYRETVYIARKGYFARDLFLEHISLCGLLGYEEFFRRHWFQKAASWINDEGCMQEYRNYEINRTELYLSRTSDEKVRKRLHKSRKRVLSKKCHSHPTVLLLVTLAHGVRQMIHYMPVTVV